MAKTQTKYKYINKRGTEMINEKKVKKIADKEYEADIQEIKAILKKLKEDEIKEIQAILKKIKEDIIVQENNFSYYSNKEYGPVANNYLPSTQACSEEEILRQHEFNYK